MRFHMLSQIFNQFCRKKIKIDKRLHDDVNGEDLF